MLRFSNFILMLVCIFSVAQTVQADWFPRFQNVGANLKSSFSGTNFFLHAAGFASTYGLVRAGTDAQVYKTFRGNKSLAAVPGAVIGSGIGALAAATYYWKSRNGDDDFEAIGAIDVIAQATVLNLGYVAFLKVTTGRAHPTNSWHLSPQEQAEQFQFGFFRNGITAYGWPSGHVSHTIAVTSALAHFFPEQPAYAWTSAGLSLYMLYSVVAHDQGQMHWFSDGVAGGLMGYAIGSSVGKNLRTFYRGTPKDTQDSKARWFWMPTVGSGYYGISASVNF